MSLITSVIVALLPILASAQSAPLNTTVLGGFPSNEYALEYYRASHRSNVTNSVGFPGYNWTVPISGIVSESNTNSTNTWQMHLNYSTVVVPTSSGNVTTGNTAISMTFPGQEWSLGSDWRLCASLALSAFPDSIASKGTNNSDSSCAQYIGQGCVDAVLEAYRGQSTSGGRCPIFPGFANIPACSGVTDILSGGIGTTAITNTTSPDLVYASDAYVNASNPTGQTYSRSNVTYQGLSSGQAFASFLTVFPETNNLAAAETAESKKVRLIALQIGPSDAYVANHSGGYGWYPNTRLICARANATSGAAGLEAIPVGMMAVGMVVAGFAGLW